MIGRLKNKISEDGVLGVINACKNKIFTKVNTYVLYLDSYVVDSDLLDYRFEKLTMKLLMSFKDNVSEEKYNLLCDRIDSELGLLPYVVLYQDVVCGYYHIAIKGYHDTTVNLMYETCDNSAFLFDDHTFLHSRGKGCHKFSIIKRIQCLKSQGYSFVSVNIVEGNVFSERAYTSIGFNAKRSTSCYFRVLHKLKALDV